MSEDNNTPSIEDPAEEQKAQLKAAELQNLKDRASMLGIKFHPKIGAKKLSAMIQKYQEDQEAQDLAAEAESEEDKDLAADASPGNMFANETREQRRTREYREKDIAKKKHLELVRCQIVCMNPNKKDWNGQIFTIGNKTIGTIRKYVPFNAENGYHLPRILFEHLKTCKFQAFKTVKRNGRDVRVGFQQTEFGITELPPLTKEELNRIATRQSAQETMEV